MENNTVKMDELIGQRKQLVTDARAAALAGDKEKTEKMLADVAAIEAQIETEERLAAAEAKEYRQNRPARPSFEAPTPEAEAKRASKEAFEQYIRFGKDSLSAEQRKALGSERRDIVTSSPGSGQVSGGYLIPQEFDSFLTEALKEPGTLRSAVRLKVTDNSGRPMKFATWNDTGNTFATVSGEIAALTDANDPTITGAISYVDTLARLVKVSYQELEDSSFDLAELINKAFVVSLARTVEADIVAGNSSNIAAIGSVVDSSKKVTSAASGVVAYADFISAYGKMDAAYVPKSKWAMSQAMRAYVMGLVDLYGRPLFIPSPNTGKLDQILGQDIVISNSLAAETSTTNPCVLFGSFEDAYLLRTDGPLSIKRLDERFADSLAVGFLAYQRVGGVGTDAGTHPIASITTKA